MNLKLQHSTASAKERSTGRSFAGRAEIGSLDGAGELIKKEFSFDRHLNIEVIVVDALSRQTLTKVKVSQTVARDLGGL